ncbi:MAG: helix-hairpin-helix domain-containing protein [Chitinophagales bacterium]
MREKMVAYLSFTRKERLGVLVLLAVVLILFVVPYFVQPAIGSRDEQAFQKYGKGIRKFQSDDNGKRDNKKEVTEADPPGQPSHYASEKNRVSGEDQEKSSLFYFDPNLISGEDWHRLGLPDKLVMTITHYIQKGGSFRTASDLKKLYGLKNEDYDRLFPYVRIREQPAAIREPEIKIQSFRRKNAKQWKDFHARYDRSGWALKNDREPPSENSSEQRMRAEHLLNYFSYVSGRKKPEDLDINQADSSLWCRLPGIGMRLASRIIHFREKLGGFYEVEQLRETFGLPDSTFENIRPFLHIQTSDLQKIDLNSAVQESLQAHPYIRWRLARGIIQYREQHGRFKTVGELQQLAQMDPEKFKKLEPYLEVK